MLSVFPGPLCMHAGSRGRATERGLAAANKRSAGGMCGKPGGCARSLARPVLGPQQWQPGKAGLLPLGRSDAPWCARTRRSWGQGNRHFTAPPGQGKSSLRCSAAGSLLLPPRRRPAPPHPAPTHYCALTCMQALMASATSWGHSRGTSTSLISPLRGASRVHSSQITTPSEKTSDLVVTLPSRSTSGAAAGSRSSARIQMQRQDPEAAAGSRCSGRIQMQQ
jgi:hypothetical protein